ncbi:MAG: hypothetical protein ACTTJX_02425 [Fusobacterium sp.]|uniref:hypothetical protein n=1 Tax=Fusobacterium sp. TaxID=68766 RepID=UPI00261B183E|nr:hypothetical protein [uncultured Fusobacterium sp.]
MKFFLILISTIFISCSQSLYHIRSIENYDKKGRNEFDLSYCIDENLEERRYIDIYIEQKNDSSIIKIYSRIYNIKNENYSSADTRILNNVILTKNNGEKIYIQKDNIKYEKQDAIFKVNEYLKGPITLVLGEVMINNKKYKTSKIYLQKLKGTYMIFGFDIKWVDN